MQCAESLAASRPVVLASVKKRLALHAEILTSGTNGVTAVGPSRKQGDHADMDTKFQHKQTIPASPNNLT